MKGTPGARHVRELKQITIVSGFIAVHSRHSDVLCFVSISTAVTTDDTETL